MLREEVGVAGVAEADDDGVARVTLAVECTTFWVASNCTRLARRRRFDRFTDLAS